MKRKLIPQFELPGQENAFNLAGETIKQAEPVEAPKADTQTPYLFAEADFERWLSLQEATGLTVTNPEAVEKIQAALKLGARLTIPK